MCRPPGGEKRSRIAAREFFRCILEGNEDVVLCEASRTLDLEFSTPNAGLNDKVSVLALVAPESRGRFSKAIFRSAHDRVTRVRLRCRDGRLADALILCEGTPSEEKPQKKPPPYIVGLFSLEPKTAKVRGGQIWTEEACRKAAELGSKLVLTTTFCAAVDVDESGAVAAAAGLVVPRRVNPIDLIADRDRRRVVETFARAKTAGHTVSSAVHDMTDIGQVLTTCAFRQAGGALLFVYACSTAADGRRADLSFCDDDHKSDDDDDSDDQIAASFQRELSLVDVRGAQHQRGGDVRKRKRERSTVSFASPNSVTASSSSASRPCFDETKADKSPRSQQRMLQDDDEWGHFVFPDEPAFDLPPIGHAVSPTTSKSSPGPIRVTVDAAAQPKGGSAVPLRTYFTDDEDDEYDDYDDDDDALDDLDLPSSYTDGESETPHPPKWTPTTACTQLETSLDFRDDPRGGKYVIDLDSVLPRQQSIENYEAAVRALPPAPAPAYETVQLDSILDAVLPRPESLLAFRDTMREIGSSVQQRARSFIGLDDDDDHEEEQQQRPRSPRERPADNDMDVSRRREVPPPPVQEQRHDVDLDLDDGVGLDLDDDDGHDATGLDERHPAPPPPPLASETEVYVPPPLTTPDPRLLHRHAPSTPPQPRLHIVG